MTALATTRGLYDATAPDSELQQIQWAVAAGSGDAITAAYPRTVEELSDGLCLAFRALEANTIVDPTFSPDELTPYPLVKGNRDPLAPGDIQGNGQELIARFNDAVKQWVLINF